MSCVVRYRILLSCLWHVNERGVFTDASFRWWHHSFKCFVSEVWLIDIGRGFETKLVICFFQICPSAIVRRQILRRWWRQRHLRRFRVKHFLLFWRCCYLTLLLLGDELLKELTVLELCNTRKLTRNWLLLLLLLLLQLRIIWPDLHTIRWDCLGSFGRKYSFLVKIMNLVSISSGIIKSQTLLMTLFLQLSSVGIEFFCAFFVKIVDFTCCYLLVLQIIKMRPCHYDLFLTTIDLVLRNLLIYVDLAIICNGMIASSYLVPQLSFHLFDSVGVVYIFFITRSLAHFSAELWRTNHCTLFINLLINHSLEVMRLVTPSELF